MSTENQKQYWRDYNKSERGKARYKKWAKSLQGKAYKHRYCSIASV